MDGHQPPVAPPPKSALKEILANLNFGSPPFANNKVLISHFREVGDFSNNSVQCSKCLRRGHLYQGYRFPVCCLIHFNYGH
jgi:hypothetical protein